MLAKCVVVNGVKMTKKIEKIFYVSDEHLKEFAKGSYFRTEKDERYKHEITISWDVPEKKIELTESQFDEAWTLYGIAKSSTYHELRSHLFGKGE